MARGRGANFKREAAELIAKKLRADLVPGAKHIRATVRYNGRQIASFGIRHSKDVGHDYIPAQIFVTTGQARKFAACTMSYEEYIAALRSQGKLPSDPPGG